jgi:pimeloyl-ACP methyl ester carboxylesterase
MPCTAPVRSTVRVFASLMVMFAITAGLARAAEQRVQEVNYSSVEVHGITVFYREAEPADGPPMLLLHGLPASSHMCRDLMPKLADRYRVIAPDYPGYGHSAAPSAGPFNYPFERLKGVVESLSEKLALARYNLYMQDFGGPVGFRLATHHPERAQALIVQNAVAHAEGLSDGFAPARAYWANRSAETEKPMRDLLTLKTTRFQYLHGASRPERINPDSWILHQALLDRPGNADIQLAIALRLSRPTPRPKVTVMVEL